MWSPLEHSIQCVPTLWCTAKGRHKAAVPSMPIPNDEIYASLSNYFGKKKKKL